jgi:hypothetical protein
VQVVAVKCRVPTINDEARGATATTTSLLTPLKAQLRAVDLEVIKCFKSTLTIKPKRSTAPIVKVLLKSLTLW